MAIRMTSEERGLFAENIIANMFIGSGRKVFHNGIEKTNPDFYRRFNERKERSDKIDYDTRLRQQLSKPDFIVECVDGEYDFVEVKFRSVQHLTENQSIESLFERINIKKYFDSYREFWKPEIILVTNEALNTGNFTVLSYPYIENDISFRKIHCKKMGDIQKWGINPDIITLNEEIIKKTFIQF